MAFDFQSCIECHEGGLTEDRIRQYLHSPFAQHQCDACHAAPAAPVAVNKILTKQVPAPAKRQKVTWLGDSAMQATHHGFVLPGDQMGESLVIEAQGEGGRFSRQEINVPLLAELEEVEESGQPPVVSEVRVLKVERSVFLSVTIGWRTDRLADARVDYRDNDHALTADSGGRFGRQHRVVLHNLQLDKTYSFTVTSRDLFGRSQVSPAMTFSTAKPLVSSLPDNASADETEVGISSYFRRLGRDYLLELTLDQPATVYVGRTGAVRQQDLQAAGDKAASQTDLAHEGLSGDAVIAMAACGKCHVDQNVATHPVNVFPKPGMTIPPEYPTLPDGRITCASCHMTHSSDFEYLSRKPGKRELCIGCHVDML